MKARAPAKKRARPDRPLLDAQGLLNLTDEKPFIQVAVVGEPQTASLADVIENLLAKVDGFRTARFEYRAEFGIKSRAVSSSHPDVVMIALHPAPLDQLQLLFSSLHDAFPDRPVLVAPVEPITFNIYSTLEMGASDFLLPPLRLEELLPRIIRQACVARHADQGLQELKQQIGLRQIVGESPLLLREIQRIPRFARCDATVLISGESGTGKEIFARAIHYLSIRASAPFVPVNCGALPEQLVESEVFGHQRGAFTGAIAEAKGLIAEAEGGTLFLDEVDALTPQAQVKVLRFLQDREYRAVGSQRILHADVRIIAAANVEFEQLVPTGKFREDLFYRLNVLPLTLPALRDRRGDIPLLTQHLLEKQAALTQSPPKKLSLGALNRLLSHTWPGNVRELENVLRAQAFSRSRYHRASGSGAAWSGDERRGPVIQRHESTRRPPFRTRLFVHRPARPRWKRHSGSARGEEESPRLLGAFAQARFARQGLARRRHAISTSLGRPFKRPGHLHASAWTKKSSGPRPRARWAE